jgi:hypothetical protein
MSSQRSFAKDFFRSRVSDYALLSLFSGMFTAWLSSRLISAWWESYLQSVSATLIGVAATVWLINFSLELQTNELSRKLSRATAEVALKSLHELVDHLLLWLPPAPDENHSDQLRWINDRIEQVHSLSTALTPLGTDPIIKTLLADFALKVSAWSQAFADLNQLIRLTAPHADRAASFSTLQSSAVSLIESARSLATGLSALYDTS